MKTSLSQFFPGPLAINPKAVDSIARRIVAFLDDEDAPKVSTVDCREMDLEIEVSGGVAVVRVDGLITKDVQWCYDSQHPYGIPATSSAELSAACRVLAAEPRCAGVLFIFDSPGGEVAGVAEAAAAIAALAQVKPVQGFIADQADSAGYWFASQCPHLTTNPTASVGCIGVYRALYDTSKMFEAMGVESKVAKTGANKATGLPGEPITDEQMNQQRSEVGEVFSVFKAAVMSGRRMTAAVLDPLADGRSFIGRQALDAGLVDAIGSCDGAMIRIRAAVAAFTPNAAAALVGAGAPDKEQAMKLSDLRAKVLALFDGSSPTPATAPAPENQANPDAAAILAGATVPAPGDPHPAAASGGAGGGAVVVATGVTAKADGEDPEAPADEDDADNDGGDEWKFNSEAAQHAASLIDAGKVDHESDWDYDSSKHSKKLIKSGGMGKWCLSMKGDDADDTTKSHWMHPTSKDAESVHYRGLKSAKKSAEARGMKGTAEACGGLMDKIAAKWPEKYDPAEGAAKPATAGEAAASAPAAAAGAGTTLDLNVEVRVVPAASDAATPSAPATPATPPAAAASSPAPAAAPAPVTGTPAGATSGNAATPAAPAPAAAAGAIESEEDKYARLTALAKAFPQNQHFAMEMWTAGHDVAKAKAVQEERKKSGVIPAAATAAGGPAPLTAGVAPGNPTQRLTSAADVAKAAEAEWASKPELQKQFFTKESYVAFRRYQVFHGLSGMDTGTVTNAPQRSR